MFDSPRLNLPVFEIFKDKRIILASSSPRRKEILARVGFHPEIVPSTFKEDLSHELFNYDLTKYPIATCTEKAREVFLRSTHDENEKQFKKPDLVISADTVVIFPPSFESHQGHVSRILEKPGTKEEQSKILNEMNGKQCEIVTGISIMVPAKNIQGVYKIHSTSASTVVQFANNSKEFIQAYVDSEEGLDRSGGFATQGMGGVLVKSIHGDYDNVAGFPSSHFWRWIHELYNQGIFDKAWN
ncbi:septum formation protein Maf [Kwoniella sp. B9012]|uniref:Septum formation protein Maf n=1 Tax=Kwoniella europaea PYCC6329 TaxID=1423913 RepID=A0AAX4KQ69_9TREE